MDLNGMISFFTHLSLDWIILFAFAVFVALDVLRAGASRACSLALALPATLLLITELPQAFFAAGLVKQVPGAWGSLVVFAVLLVIMYILARHMCGEFSDAAGQPIQALMAGAATAVIAVAIWIDTPALQQIWHFGPQVQDIFGGQWRFWWFVGAFGALAFSRD